MIIAVIGKGGVGKTTITALLLRRLLDSGQTPLLAVDADPSSCLGPALGITVNATLAELRESMRHGSGRPASQSASEWFALRMQESVVENPGFDLLTMGRPEGKGCYCFVNNLIRDHLDRLSRGYRHVLLDCEAGLEHLSRRTSGRLDLMVCVANRSRMAAETVRRSLAVYSEVQGTLPPRIDLMLNGFSHGEPLATGTAAAARGENAPFGRVFVIPTDPEVAELESAGKSLLDLHPASPAAAALRGWELAA